jgi:hypothetical protein
VRQRERRGSSKLKVQSSREGPIYRADGKPPCAGEDVGGFLSLSSIGGRRGPGRGGAFCPGNPSPPSSPRSRVAGRGSRGSGVCHQPWDFIFHIPPSSGQTRQTFLYVTGPFHLLSQTGRQLIQTLGFAIQTIRSANQTFRFVIQIVCIAIQMACFVIQTIQIAIQTIQIAIQTFWLTLL